MMIAAILQSMTQWFIFSFVVKHCYCPMSHSSTGPFKCYHADYSNVVKCPFLNSLCSLTVCNQITPCSALLATSGWSWAPSPGWAGRTPSWGSPTWPSAPSVSSWVWSCSSSTTNMTLVTLAQTFQTERNLWCDFQAFCAWVTLQGVFWTACWFSVNTLGSLHMCCALCKESSSLSMAVWYAWTLESIYIYMLHVCRVFFLLFK